jgi:hypothetical protein
LGGDRQLLVQYPPSKGTTILGKVVIGSDIDAATETPGQRFTAILFRGKIYVATPRHMDCIKLAFEGMTHEQKRRVSNRIADGKENLLFGFALADGSDWEWNEEFQAARMIMYGFD